MPVGISHSDLKYKKDTMNIQKKNIFFFFKTTQLSEDNFFEKLILVPFEVIVQPLKHIYIIHGTIFANFSLRFKYINIFYIFGLFALGG